MIDPERLLQTDLQDATSLRERELLGSLKPSANAQTAVWRRVIGQGVLVAGATAAAATTAAVTASASSVGASPSAALGATVTASGAASAATGASTVTAATGVMGSLAAKAGVALIVAAPILGGTLYLTQGAPQREAPGVEALRPAAPDHTAQSTVTEPLKQAQDLAVPVPEPAKPEANPPPAQSNADALREENRLLREARSLERSGNPGQALRILNELDRLFVRGALLQEREILRIQSLSASGSRSAAKTRAEQFLKRYPASPYAAHVRSMLDGTSP